MIRLKDITQDSDSIKNQFTLTSDEPVTLTVTETQSGHLVAHIYRGTSPGEFDEPIGAFDSNTGNVTWSDNLVR